MSVGHVGTLHVLLILALSAGAGAAAGDSPATNAPPAAAGTNAIQLPSVFEMPALGDVYYRLTARLIQQAKQGDMEGSAATCRKVIEVAPFMPDGYYNLACVQAQQGKADDAFASLEEALRHGYTNSAHMEQDEDLTPLRRDPRFRVLTKKAQYSGVSLPERKAMPEVVSNGVAHVRETNTGWDGANGVLRGLFTFDSGYETNVRKREVVLEHGDIGNLLREWYKAGTAAGNFGDFYDNRDGGHSLFPCSRFPQLTRIEYGPEAIAGKVNYGMQVVLFFNGVVIGNSSTAATAGPYWSSQARMGYDNAWGVVRLYAQYVGNALYFYPEHRDHDPGHNGQGDGYGDVFAANTPYLIISQGSSGSDQVFMDAVACTLAAFQPKVKDLLVRTGTLMPAVQMIFRASNKTVAKPEDYLTGAAHPTVFDGGQLDAQKMVRMAHEMTPEQVPPMVQLRVLDEDRGVPGRDYFDAGEREVLFDTPCAVARVVRSTQYRHRLVVSAAGSKDLNRKPLTWHWVVLRGDADAIQIKPKNQEGSLVEISVPYRARGPIRPGSPLESNRVDIGAFVNNGVYYSAPAFLTFFTLDNEARAYDSDGRILSVAYTGAREKGNYVDPRIDIPKSWRDDYHYDKEGLLLGWTRTRGTETEEFTRDGALVLKRDKQDRPAEAQTVRYVASQVASNQPPVLEQQLGDVILKYRYAGDKDRTGSIDAREPVVGAARKGKEPKVR